MADERRARRPIRDPRAAFWPVRARDRREWLESQRTMFVEQIARREAELDKVMQAVEVLRSTIDRFKLEIEIYRSRLDGLEDELAEFERAEQREFEMGPESDRFADMTIADAAYEVLKEVGRGMHVTEIWGALSRGGLRSSAQRPTLSVTTALLRDERFERVGKNTYAIRGTQPKLIEES